ncbi:MAG TPA: hypothetical protein DCL35_01490 [Candidatus Omnitrophica bacterium]|nr:hypothetical protein [Candidatus Omnitrophota bacterium]
MPIKTVEMICLPCNKCEGVEVKVREMIRNIEMINRIKILFEFKHTKTLQDITRYSLNPSQTPAILINGNVECAGKVDFILFKRRLEAIQKSC